MNVYEFARECEKAAEKTYLNLAVKAGNKGMKAIFTMLAEMEKKHFDALLQLCQDPGNSFAFFADETQPGAPSIDGSADGIMMEVARMMDEASR